LRSGMVRTVAWGVLIGLCGLIIVNSLPYFSFRGDMPFLAEKGPLVSNPLWRACFYGHVLGGMGCLASAPFLFWGRLRARHPALHRGLGRLYGIVVLGWAGPAGLFLALHAKGGDRGPRRFSGPGAALVGCHRAGSDIDPRRAAGGPSPVDDPFLFAGALRRVVPGLPDGAVPGRDGGRAQLHPVPLAQPGRESCRRRSVRPETVRSPRMERRSYEVSQPRLR
jgi:hypothetical protein